MRGKKEAYYQFAARFPRIHWFEQLFTGLEAISKWGLDFPSQCLDEYAAEIVSSAIVIHPPKGKLPCIDTTQKEPSKLLIVCYIHLMWV
jgi:hypothetical protein